MKRGSSDCNDENTYLKDINFSYTKFYAGSGSYPPKCRFRNANHGELS